MTNHADLIAALRIPMNVTLPGAPELDEYDEQRKAAADAIEAALAEVYRRGQEDMRERAAALSWSDDEDRPWENWGEDKHVKVAQTVSEEISVAIRAIPIKEKADE